MKEKDMQTLFTKWLKKNGETGAYELKICKGKSLPFNKVQEHQVDALLKSRNGRYAYKISDMSMGLKPFDCFCFNNSNAFVVIMFYVPRKPKTAYIIDIDMFLHAQIAYERKSITEDICRDIGEAIKL